MSGCDGCGGEERRDDYDNQMIIDEKNPGEDL
jgi:hypothetical protein